MRNANIKCQWTERQLIFFTTLLQQKAKLQYCVREKINEEFNKHLPQFSNFSFQAL